MSSIAALLCIWAVILPQTAPWNKCRGGCFARAQLIARDILDPDPRRAIVHRPPLIFLDEPTVGLDPELRVRFWDYFENLTQNGSTLIVSSHTMDDAAHCQKLVFLRQGMVIALGSPAELRAATGMAKATLEDAFLYFIKRGEMRENVE